MKWSCQFQLAYREKHVPPSGKAQLLSSCHNLSSASSVPVQHTCVPSLMLQPSLNAAQFHTREDPRWSEWAGGSEHPEQVVSGHGRTPGRMVTPGWTLVDSHDVQKARIVVIRPIQIHLC